VVDAVADVGEVAAEVADVADVADEDGLDELDPQAAPRNAVAAISAESDLRTASSSGRFEATPRRVKDVLAPPCRLVYVAVKNTRTNADVGARMRSYDIALIGIVLLACGIAALASVPGIAFGLPLAAALWSSAVGTFAVARRPGRR